MENVHQKHDKGYKYLLSSKRVFMEMLRSFIHAGWVAQIDEQQLVRLDKSFVLQDFSAKEADIVYRMKLQDEEVIFYILLELQSTVDERMPFRLLQYMMEIWRSIMKGTIGNEEYGNTVFQLPHIIPIVLYNGYREWSVSTSYRGILNKSALISADEPYVLNFNYYLLDVNRYELDHLQRLENLIGTVFALDQKVSSTEIVERMKRMIGVLAGLSGEQFGLFRSWFIHVIVPDMVDEQKRKEVIRRLEQSEGTEMMVYNLQLTLREEREQVRMEAMQQGIEQGIALQKQSIALKLLSTGMDVNTVASITELTEEEVRGLLQ